jgi:hypothetical protein
MNIGSGLLRVVAVAFLVICLGAGLSHAQVTPDLNSWTDTWFKIFLTRNVFHYRDIGILPKPLYRQSQTSPLPAYMYINSWDSVSEVLQVIFYTPDPDNGTYDKSRFETIDLQYFAGTDLKFVCAGEVVSGGTELGFTIYFKGVKNKSGNFVLGGETNLTTLGGYYLEVDDSPGSTERWAGSMKINGNMIPLSKLPPALQ